MSVTEAMIEQAEARIENERAARIADVQQAARRQRIGDGEAVENCQCGVKISEARRRAVPGTRQCIDCATISERRKKVRA